MSEVRITKSLRNIALMMLPLCLLLLQGGKAAAQVQYNMSKLSPMLRKAVMSHSRTLAPSHLAPLTSHLSPLTPVSVPSCS